MSKLKKLGTDPFAKSSLNWIQNTREENIPSGIRLSPIEYIKPTLLKINPLNSEYFSVQIGDEYNSLKEDIKLRGVVVPLIAKQDHMLLTGETRLKIALDLNLPVIPVQFILADLNKQEEREFLVKDNLRRRQLSAEQKEQLIRKLYPLEIKSDHRGGDRKSTKKIKSSTELLMPLPEKIQKETGIPIGTAKRILAKIRKDNTDTTQSAKPIKTNEHELEKIKKDLQRIVSKLKSSQNTEILVEFLKEIEIIKNQIKVLIK